MQGLLLFCVLLLHLTAAQKLQPAPYSFQPSLIWDGNDGQWSSFAVQIGTSPQVVRLLPSITGSSIWTVLPQGCSVYRIPDCEKQRGNLFNYNQSSSWTQKGLYKLPLEAQHYLPLSGNAYFGFDNITVSLLCCELFHLIDNSSSIGRPKMALASVIRLSLPMRPTTSSLETLDCQHDLLTSPASMIITQVC